MKISGGAGTSKVVLKSKKVVLRHSKMGHGEHCSRYVFKATKNNHVSEKEMVLQQSPQNTRWARMFVYKNCLWYQYRVIFHTFHILQPYDHNIPLSADDNQKMTLGVMHYQRFIINIVICHKDPHKRLKLFVVAFFDNTCFMMVDHSEVLNHSMAEIIE